MSLCRNQGDNVDYQRVVGALKHDSMGNTPKPVLDS